MADLTRVAEVLVAHHVFLVYEDDTGEQGHAACSHGQEFGTLADAIAHQAQMLADAGLVASETEWGVQHRDGLVVRDSREHVADWTGTTHDRCMGRVAVTRNVTPWRPADEGGEA